MSGILVVLEERDGRIAASVGKPLQPRNVWARNLSTARKPSIVIGAQTEGLAVEIATKTAGKS